MPSPSASSPSASNPSASNHEAPILSARFAVPAVPGILVRRPALLERLSAGVRTPLTLVSGPAGAGKSVLAADWTGRYRGPGRVAWLRVEPGEPPQVFWAHVLEALRRQGVRLSGGWGAGAAGELAGDPARAFVGDLAGDLAGQGGRAVLGRLAEGLARAPAPVVLVLDQFDAQVPPGIADGLAFVLRNAAPGLHLVLTGRSEPLLPLHRYRAAGEIAEIRNADLRFSREDTRTLLRNHGLAADEEDVRLLADRTEGWAAGLRLCALAMQRTADPGAFVRDFAADRSTIADYLLTEVLQAYPRATRTLLLRVSITDRIHPGLADALTGGQDGAWTLAALDRSNAFVEAVDGTSWYRVHPLFAEVLRAQLRHRHPGLEPRLRRRAARWFAGHGQPVEAVAQAAAAGDWPSAARQLVADPGVGRLLTGPDADRLRGLLSAMPPGLAGAEPALVEAALRLAEHDREGCAAALRRAAEESDPADDAVRLGSSSLAALTGRLPPELLAHRSTAAVEPGPGPAVIEPLTERERDVLSQAARMLSTEEIAAELYVSANTVKTHLKSAYRKLCVTRRSEAVHRAQALGLL
ncbi:LuxR C-terminal-related transcriptional regulator [Kitasatospora sp. NPDC058170]|uniref:LuxR C-terminal-related transcriptional regulator n=1 Tax=Kitasatospora sp. NPDC058170 TaxID=3346364 RepID=UPI0036DDEEDE